MGKNRLKYRVIPALMSALPPSFWGRLTRAYPAIFYYHMVSDAGVAHVRHLYLYKGVQVFRAELDFILRHFCPVSLGDVLEHVCREPPSPTGPSC
jgi:hypothetical protein